MKEYINLFRDCSGIYCIENIKNEKKYIGQAVNLKRRIEAHLYRLRGGYEDCGNLQKSWDKYKEESFKFYVLEECLIEELDNREKFWIEKLNSHTSKNGYNISFGGQKTSMLGRKHSIESRNKMKKKRNQRITKKETKEKISISLLGNQRVRGYKNPKSTSKYIGVHLIKKKYWTVHICFEKQNIYVGCYKTEIDAARAYNVKAIELFGEGAILNNV